MDVDDVALIDYDDDVWCGRGILNMLVFCSLLLLMMLFKSTLLLL